MAITWPGKAPADVYKYTWEPALSDGDKVSSFLLAIGSGGGTIEATASDGLAITAFISGGTAGTVIVINATAYTVDGEDLTETIYLPIRENTVLLGNTAQDIATAALRKIIGIGETPDSDQAAFALEALNDMLTEWKGRGMDIGCVLPLSLSSTLLVPDEFLSGIKSNLILALCDQFERPVTPTLQRQAVMGFELIKQRLNPTAAADYF